MGFNSGFEGLNVCNFDRESYTESPDQFPTQHYPIVGNTHRVNAVKSVLCNT